MIAVMFVIVAVACVLIGYFLGRGSNEDPQVRAIKAHAKLLKKARNASITGKDGLANIYAEAADKVLEIERE